MNSLVKNIFTSIVALAIVISVSGLQIYKHSCSTHNFSAISLIGTPVCEQDHQSVEDVDDCCKIEVENIEPSCCESEPINKSNSNSIISSEVKCCSSSVESSRIQDNLFPPVEKKIISTELLTALLSFIDDELQQSERNLDLQNNDLPPPIFGKALLQKIHQLKIDTLIC